MAHTTPGAKDFFHCHEVADLACIAMSRIKEIRRTLRFLPSQLSSSA